MIFGTLANWIAAPFNGLLAEKVEQHLTGQTVDSSGLGDILKDLPRTLGRELTKLLYYIPRAIGFLLLFFILPIIGQVLWFLFNGWMMAIQYVDYPEDNNKMTFPEMKAYLRSHRLTALGFGLITFGATLIPLLNFFALPAAVCGAVAFWVNEDKPLGRFNMNFEAEAQEKLRKPNTPKS